MNTDQFKVFTQKELKFLQLLLSDNEVIKYIYKARQKVIGVPIAPPDQYIKRLIKKNGAGSLGRNILNKYASLYKKYKRQ